MQPRTSPTSPAAQHHADVVARVWHGEPMQQPVRLPWGKLVLTIMLLALIIQVGLLAGLGWFIHRNPHGRVAQLFPFVSTTTTTTVVQANRDKETLVIPSAIQELMTAGYWLAANQGPTGLYQPSAASGLAWPLSSSGWLLSISGVVPAGTSNLVVYTDVNQPQALASTLIDPGTSFLFLKTNELTQSPVALAAADKTLQPGQRVWLVTPTAAFPRQLVQSAGPRWLSTDRAEQYWTLDVPAAVPIGTAVVDADAKLIGLLGPTDRLWPTATVSVNLKSVIQAGTIERPTAGFRALDRSTATVSGDPTAQGLLIGADEGQAALVVKGPAERSGLQVGDLITAINGQPTAGDPFLQVMKFRPGDSLTLTVTRQGKSKTITLKLGLNRS